MPYGATSEQFQRLEDEQRPFLVKDPAARPPRHAHGVEVCPGVWPWWQQELLRRWGHEHVAFVEVVGQRRGLLETELQCFATEPWPQRSRLGPQRTERSGSSMT